MVNAFLIYDLAFLVVFTLGVVLFLYQRRKNLQRQGILYLYRTKLGIKFIDSFAKKYERILKPLQYVVIACGYVLMAAMTYFIIQFAIVYLQSDVVVRESKVPVLVPLIPYLPDLFNLDFLPSFNFTYWIIIIALIAIPHEFAHGIFARLNKIKIKSTGFGFLGPFLAAFVEPDEKAMNKMKKFPQLSILAAGTFANIIFTILLTGTLWLLFAAAFVPAGVKFTDYSLAAVNVSDITSINGIPLSELKDFSINSSALINLTANNQTFFTIPSNIFLAFTKNYSFLPAYENSPAFAAQLRGAITEIDGRKIRSYSDLTKTLRSYSPGENITIKTAYQKSVLDGKIEFKEQTIQLADRNGTAVLGIGTAQLNFNGVMGSIFYLTTKIKDPFIYYESSLGAFGWFIYYLLWWSVIISLSVALVNMLPVGIFDGGRFFYLTVWAITGSEKIGKKAFALTTWAILLLVLLMMVRWVLVFF